MSIYKLADLSVDIQNRFDYIERQCRDYLSDIGTKADFCVSVSDELLEKERYNAGAEFSDGCIESVCIYREIAKKLPDFDAFLLHASVIEVNGRGIAFLARSGVGKSTHTMMWKELLGNKMQIVNGDKPIVRFFDGEPYAYGTPWCGKERLNTNTKCLLTDICFIERNTVNSVVDISKPEAGSRIMTQIFLPKDEEKIVKTLDLTDMLISKCNLHIIKCMPDISSARCAYNAIFNTKD